MKYIWPPRSSTFSPIAYITLHCVIHCAFWPSTLQQALEFSDTVVLRHCFLSLRFSFLCRLSFKGYPLSNHVIRKIFPFFPRKKYYQSLRVHSLAFLLFSFWFLSYSLSGKLLQMVELQVILIVQWYSLVHSFDPSQRVFNGTL